MRGSIPLTIVALALVAASCGGGDDDAGPESSDPAASSTSDDRPTDDTTPTSFTIAVSDECEDSPDPADYPEGEIPPAIRPCDLPTELEIEVIREGSGREAEAGDTVIADYTGFRSENGFVFDTSYTRDVPLDFVLGRGGVIAGWDQGLVGVQPGEMVRLDIPTDLAYGDNPQGDVIQPGDDLTFVLEVRAVIPAALPEDAPLDLQVEPSIGATEITTIDIVEGDGADVELGKTVVINMLLVRGDNEVVLFNTWERNDPLQIIMAEGQTLPGVFEGLQGAQVGDLRVITMPPEEAFGPDGESSLGLPAGTDLIVVAEVMGVY